MLFVLAPDTALVDDDRAARLLAAAEREWGDIPYSRIGAGAVVNCTPSEEDGVVFFNEPRPDCAADIDSLLRRAGDAGAVLVPVAMDSTQRTPPAAAATRQSFDVTDHLRRRELADDRLEVVGAALAREALSLVMPTFTLSRLRMFLCHRRSDGEQITGAVDRALSSRHEQVFRDLIDIQTGEHAQERIDEELVGADVLVFLDTPRVGESWWVAHELASALARAIPVVWVRLGADEDRVGLSVEPGAQPHIADERDSLDDAAAGAIADEILAAAHRMSMAHARTSQQSWHAMQALAAEQGASLQVLDARRRIYQVRYPSVPSSGRRYPVRPMTDIVQLFGRAHTDEDRVALESDLLARGMGPHDLECRAFDAAILLDPTTSGIREVGEWSVAEHPEAFLESLRPARAPAPRRPRLLLFGAFPAGELARDQVIPALQAVATTWLRLDGTIVCGGHPTFVPLLVDAVRLLGGDAPRERLIVFQSRWFAAPAQLADLAESATVIATEAADTREESLTVMRSRMIDEASADAVIALGGRTDEHGAHSPGLDEEVRLARLAGLPVYLLGSPGGQAAELARRSSGLPRPWTDLGNLMTVDQNEWLRDTDDFERATRQIAGTLDR